MVDASVERQVLSCGNNPGFYGQALCPFMAKGGPHFPRDRPDDPSVAAQYTKPFGLISKAK